MITQIDNYTEKTFSRRFTERSLQGDLFIACAVSQTHIVNTV